MRLEDDEAIAGGGLDEESARDRWTMGDALLLRNALAQVISMGGIY